MVPKIHAQIILILIILLLSAVFSSSVQACCFHCPAPLVVDAGEDQECCLTTYMDGTVIWDDVNDVNQQCIDSRYIEWTRYSGPNEVNFADETDVGTLVTFYGTGEYTLRLCASHYPWGQGKCDVVNISVFDELSVDAGTDQIIDFDDTNSTPLNAEVISCTESVKLEWLLQSGPSSVTFDPNAYVEDPDVIFTQTGVYVLEIDVNDGGENLSDTVEITVHTAPDVNIVSISNPVHIGGGVHEVYVDATVTDDGWPDPPGLVTRKWTSVPSSNVTFSPSDDVEDPTVTFTQSGTYTLTLDANDGNLHSDDEVTVYISPVGNIIVDPNDEVLLDNPAFGGDPVLLKTGEHYFQTRDLSIKGRVLDVAIERQYRGKSEYNSCFGYGWDINYNLKVRQLKTDSDTIVLLNGKNAIRHYTKDPVDSNLYCSSTDAGNYFVYDNGTFTLQKKDGIDYGFDINGNLSSITDLHDNTITFAYSDGLLPVFGPSEYFLDEQFGGPSDGRGRVAMMYKLTTITDDIGRQIDFTYYDSNGLLSTITDFADRTWTYTYDAKNDLRSIEGPTGLTTTYTYDNNHNLLTVTDPNGQTWLENTYDSSDRVIYQTYGAGTFGFSYNDNNEVTVTDRGGNDCNIVYNNVGSVVSETASPATKYYYFENGKLAEKVFPAGNRISYSYDSEGNLTAIRRDPNDGNDPILTTFTYDPNLNLVETITDPLGNVTTFDYNDTNGNLETITYPTVTTADQGDVNMVVNFTYNSYGQIETITAPDDIVTKYVYYDTNDINDADCGRLQEIIVDYNELNITTEYKYDASGNIVEVNDPNHNITKFEYNNLDLLKKITSPLNDVVNLYYNDNKMLEQIERVKTGDNQLIDFAYNILDKLNAVMNPLEDVSTFDYDDNDNLSDVNDAEENNTHFEYNDRGLLWKVTDANGNITEYSYTLNGDINDVNDAMGNMTSYEYDGFDRLIQINYPDDSNEKFSYDDNSNLTSVTNRKGETINYQYDALNRLILKDRPSEPNTVIRYDIAGRIYDVNDNRSVSSGGGITSYSYDRIGRVNDVNGIESRTVSYEYDERSLRTKLTYPDDTDVTYEYDELGRIETIKYEGSPAAEYEYDELGRRKVLTLGNDANATYDYDLNNRLTILTNNIDVGSDIVFDYNSYDKVGNRLSCIIDEDENAAHVYSYDEIYRLVFVDYNDGGTTSYTYDALGNRDEVNDGSVTGYDVNCLNQYTSVGGTNYSYDKNGNLTDDGTYLYYYDCENRLTDVNNQSDQQVASYEYDYLGRRVKKTVYGSPNVVTKYCYDGDQVIAEYDGSNTLLRKFVYGPGIDEPICMIDCTGQSEVIYYYHFDGLGSVVALSDSTANIIERYSYDVFGEPNTTSTVDNPYMFTGRRIDTETDLYYYRARYYAYDIGRFLQTDPIGYIAGMNLYSYCGNNPTNFVDSMGLDYSMLPGAYDWTYSLQKIKFEKWVYTGRTYTVEETERIKRFGRIRGFFGPFGWHEGLHFLDPGIGGYDYKGGRLARQTKTTEWTDYFWVKTEKGSVKMEDGDFGNYMAGYLTQWYRGTVSHVHWAGDIEAFGKDDQDSYDYIELGKRDAIRDKNAIRGKILNYLN